MFQSYESTCKVVFAVAGWVRGSGMENRVFSKSFFDFKVVQDDYFDQSCIVRDLQEVLLPII